MKALNGFFDDTKTGGLERLIGLWPMAY